MHHAKVDETFNDNFLLLYSGATDHAKHCKITGNTLLEDSNDTAESLPSITFNLLDIKQRQLNLNKEIVEMMRHVFGAEYKRLSA